MAAASIAGRKFRVGERQHTAALPPVSILKPLHGAEPGLLEALAGSLRQNYPRPLELGGRLQDAADPAAASSAHLKIEFPEQNIAVFLEARQHARNRNISNLINLLGHANHDILVTAASDI